MGKVWVLDTSTKGTGATMVPLESILRKPSGDGGAIYVPPARAAKAPAPAEPRRPRLFKVVDIRSRTVLAEDATARATIGVLNGVRSIVDVNVYVWLPASEQWRLLTFDEQRLLWEHRDQTPPAPSSGGPRSERDSA